MFHRILAALLLLALFAAPPGLAQTSIHLAHGQPQDSSVDPAAAAASQFRRSLDELSGGTLKAAIFPDGQLGGNRDMAGLVAKGVLHSALVTVGGLAPLYPLAAVTGMPFALDRPQAAYALYDGEFGRMLAADIEARTGLVVLGFADAGGMHVLTNSRRPIREPADMVGLKIRTIPGYEALDAMIRALGAQPVKVSSREEFQALEMGVIDGQMNPPSVVLGRRYHHVQSYATLTSHLYSPYVWIYNRAAFEKLSPAEQQAVRDAARRAVAAGRDLTGQLDHSERGSDGLSRRLTVQPLTVEARQAFKAATQDKVAEVLTTRLGEDGTRMLAEFMRAAAKANADSAP
ncbi:TRAP-type transport system periplasmic component predicted N-acetylneuraminate-binding protein [Paramagnetospirillum magnetotacticum MS-1]|uniref:TRAP-type transport system periplasmic component predicted N-acetylneuraminate-binding protein n=1 Tax=Paramagnetospirillum magnetotacticum MS-1 TaxID=272627 RepID=A0A0C2YYQ1_PARME|nr:TRAP transporter substrate-binding protein DctP [Paramagnetospirillum magnetotacticum]KIL99800.1 TRAP-type transport system periplasmic component predicted N-acetylneuraminate-binding protein [Paramagnetospirillum magnetotacticum MS-1]